MKYKWERTIAQKKYPIFDLALQITFFSQNDIANCKENSIHSFNSNIHQDYVSNASQSEKCEGKKVHPPVYFESHLFKVYKGKFFCNFAPFFFHFFLIYEGSG